jgi:hypothetical protein
MNLRDWIYSFIKYVPSPFGGPARWIADRVYGIFDDGVKFARWIGKGAATMAARGVVYLALALSFAYETATTLQWLALTEIPRRITGAINTVKQWVAPLVDGIRNTLQHAISALTDWAQKRIAEIINAANSLKAWSLGKINWIQDYLNNTVGKWYERLTSPTKFAEWILGALINALLRYLYVNRDKLARWFVDSSPAFTTWLTRQLSSIIGRMF